MGEPVLSLVLSFSFIYVHLGYSTLSSAVMMAIIFFLLCLSYEIYQQHSHLQQPRFYTTHEQEKC